MSRRKSVLGIAVLFALALSAFTAANASAGATAYTCVKDAAGTLNGAHCLTSGGTGWKDVAIAQDTTTTGTATNANTAEGTTAAQSATLKGTLAGTITELTCSTVHGEGTFENRNVGEMFGHAEGTLVYTGCVVKAPAGKGCKVAGETVTTSALTGRTEGNGSEVKIQPKEGTTFTSIKIEGCSTEALNQTFPVTGSLKAKTNGATLTSTESDITTQNTLKFGGNKAGLEGALTLKAHSKAGEETNPLTVTEG